MNAVEMKFGRVPHGIEILRQAAGFENRTGPVGFVKAPLTSNANRGHYKKECTPLLKHAVSESMLTTNVH